MKNKTQQSDFSGFHTFSELLAWLKKTPSHIVKLVEEAKNNKN